MRYLATVSYDGSNYSGYQVQPNRVTIQSVIEQALSKMHKDKPIKIVASGRTDAGVHAIGQTFHFDSELEIPEANWKRALNSLLPADVVILDIERVPDTFHARFHAVKKTYKYLVLNQVDPSPFHSKYTAHIKQELDIKVINQACEYLIGTHDFTSFCAANSGVKGDKSRTIYQASCEKEDHLIAFLFTGDGFLYNMVRIIVGTLLEIGLGKREPTEMEAIISMKDRDKAGKTAPPQGLYLEQVEY